MKIKLYFLGLLILCQWSLLSAQDNFSSSFDAEEIIYQLEAEPDAPNLRPLLIQYKAQLLSIYEQQFEEVLSMLNSLRDPLFQRRIQEVAQAMEGVNLYHDFTDYSKKFNEEKNTCVNGWCQIMAMSGPNHLKALLEENIEFTPATRAIEEKKSKPNLKQARPKYIHVQEILDHCEKMGFVAIDLDLAQRGDFCVQYYRDKKRFNTFSPQHISIIDQIIPWGNGLFELRDWHEGIEGLPFIYRTASNLKSSHNNIFAPQNVYFGYQNQQGKEREVKTANPNVCQAYAYFGENVASAELIIEELNYVRGQLEFLKKLPNSSNP